jgi:hypothetical protein
MVFLVLVNVFPPRCPCDVSGEGIKYFLGVCKATHPIYSVGRVGMVSVKQCMLIAVITQERIQKFAKKCKMQYPRI